MDAISCGYKGAAAATVVVTCEWVIRGYEAGIMLRLMRARWRQLRLLIPKYSSQMDAISCTAQQHNKQQPKYKFN
jgi:hypothetical protein